jgi:hypothetical protein
MAASGTVYTEEEVSCVMNIPVSNDEDVLTRLLNDYNYLHQQIHNYFFIKHSPRLHVST